MGMTMTGDEFPKECALKRLSDAAYRTHHEGLSFSNERELDGRITRRDLRRFAETDDPDAAVAELVAARFWVPAKDGDGWVIRHHIEHQLSHRELVRRRAQAAERQRRKRARDAEGADAQGP